MQWLKRLLAFGLGLVLFEAALQVAALFVEGSRAGSAGSGGSAAGGATVLCLGDSHTFGLNVRAEDTWPARLEARMARHDPGARAINRGQIGKHTGHVLAELERDLLRYEPASVLVLAGVNNAWSRGAMRGEGGGEPAYMALRTVKLALILAQRFGLDASAQSATHGAANGASAPRYVEDPALLANPPRPGEVRREELGDGRTRVLTLDRDGRLVEFEIGGGVIEPGEESLAATWIEGDLARIAARVRADRAEPVFLTYAIEEGPVLPVVNAAIRRAAEANGVLLVDQAALARGWIAEFGRDRLFFNDAHPRREGYELLAAAIHDALLAAGRIGGEPAGDAAAVLRARSAPAPVLEARAAGDGLALALRYEPGLEFTVWLARSADTGFVLGGTRIPLDRDTLFEVSREWPELSGAFDGDGRAEVLLGPGAVEAIGAGGALALLLVRTPDWSIIARTEPVAIRP